MRLHLEEVGKVRPNGDLEVESDQGQTVVGDVDVLVDPVPDRAAERQAEDAAGMSPSSVANGHSSGRHARHSG